ncbi:MAG: pyrroline-5-carboxylate reductase [Coriobacteriia bacterium]|nr:pyrroline-5-carboxylate reductase [Coriobacteriia bacterium]
MASIAIVGGGRMGEALLAGLLASGRAQPADIAVAEPSPTRRDEIAERYGIRCAERGADVAGDTEVVVLAVKPRIVEAVAREIGPALSAGTIVVSIAAGVSTAAIEAVLPDTAHVVRVMPNTPAMVGAGMSVVSGGSRAPDADVERVRALLEAVGEAVVIPESQQDAATAVSGSGPAYVAVFVEALARAGVSQGMPYETALKLATQTTAGTAALLAETGRHPEELADAVASPGGTTAAALEALEDRRFRAAVAAAVAAATERSKGLGG